MFIGEPTRHRADAKAVAFPAGAAEAVGAVAAGVAGAVATAVAVPPPSFLASPADASDLAPADGLAADEELATFVWSSPSSAITAIVVPTSTV